MDTVSFTRMEDGTKEDYDFLTSLEEHALAGLPDRLLEMLAGAGDVLEGYKISRFEHGLQSATRAYRDGREEDYVVMALLHDIADGIAPMNHSEVAGAILRPYVSERLYWMAKHHGMFQVYYFGHHMGLDRNMRERYRDSPYYDDLVEFCEKYDQNCFDPDYENLPLEFFEPMVRNVFSREPYAQELKRTGTD